MITILESILNKYKDESFLTLTGFDDCILGVDEVDLKLIYSKTKILGKLMSDNVTTELDAIEYYNFNILGSYVGEQTPIFLDDYYE